MGLSLDMNNRGGIQRRSRHHATLELLVPGVVWENRLVVVLQESIHLAHDVELPVVQNLSQVGHAAHVHPLSWARDSDVMLLRWFPH